jgi:hypothetical protein
MSPNVQNMVYYTFTDLNLKRFGEKKNIAAYKRILFASQSPILAKPEVFKKKKLDIMLQITLRWSYFL